MPMTPDEAVAALLSEAEADRGKWPKERERPILTAINTWVALMECDKGKLKEAANWRDHRRDYRVDPLPECITDAWAGYLWGDEAKLVPANEADLELLEDLVGADFASELERASGMCVGEGEIWARLYVDRDVSDRPLIDWLSRAAVFPYWVGRRLAAAAVVTELRDPADDKNVVWRHLEIHTNGYLENVLYRGKAGELGERADLAAHPDTASVDESWTHGLPTGLLFRIPNRIRRDPRIGVSDFRGILDYLLDLNEACSIGSTNARLTLRKRLVVNASYARSSTQRNDLELNPEEDLSGQGPPRPFFDVAEDVLVEDPLDVELGKAGSDPIRVVEYSFDAEQLIAWKRELVESSLTRVGLTGQYVGVGEAAGVGYAISGTALRLRLIPTDSRGRAKARYWIGTLPTILETMQRLDALGDAAGGFQRTWTDAASAPTVERRAGLPPDDLEEAQRHQALLAAGAESTETAVRELHPDWDDAQVQDEVRLIREEKPAAPSSMFGA